MVKSWSDSPVWTFYFLPRRVWAMLVQLLLYTSQATHFHILTPVKESGGKTYFKTSCAMMSLLISNLLYLSVRASRFGTDISFIPNFLQSRHGWDWKFGLLCSIKLYRTQIIFSLFCSCTVPFHVWYLPFKVKIAEITRAEQILTNLINFISFMYCSNQKNII